MPDRELAYVPGDEKLPWSWIPRSWQRFALLRGFHFMLSHRSTRAWSKTSTQI